MPRTVEYLCREKEEGGVTVEMRLEDFPGWRGWGLTRAGRPFEAMSTTMEFILRPVGNHRRVWAWGGLVMRYSPTPSLSSCSRGIAVVG